MQCADRWQVASAVRAHLKGCCRVAWAQACTAQRLLSPAPTVWPHPRWSARAYRQGLPARRKTVTESVPRSHYAGRFPCDGPEPRKSALSLYRTLQKLAETAWRASPFGRRSRGYPGHLTSRRARSPYGPRAPSSGRPFPGSTLEASAACPRPVRRSIVRARSRLPATSHLPGAKASVVRPGHRRRKQPFEHAEYQR